LAEASTEATFEQSLAELEQIVRQLEEGQLGLAESLASYELGVKRLKECYQLLERAERRIELLERVDAAGEGVTRPFDAAATIDGHALAADGQPLLPKPKLRQTIKPPRLADAASRGDLDERPTEGPRDLF
jgi:exodeoxyribonuclease VII small subunit